MEEDRPFISFRRPNRKMEKIEIPSIQEIEGIYKGLKNFSSYIDDDEIHLSFSNDSQRYVAKVVREEQSYNEGLIYNIAFRSEIKKGESLAIDQDNIFDIIIECFYFIEGRVD